VRLTAALLFSSLTTFAAATYSIGTTAPALNSTTEIGLAKYKMDTGVDMMLRNIGSVGGADIQMGAFAALSGQTFAFSLQHIVAEGLIFALTDVTPPAIKGSPFVASWGTFATPPGGTNVATSNGKSPEFHQYAALSLSARAIEGTAGTRKMTFSDLAFVGTGLTLGSGAFTNSFVDNDPGTTEPTEFTQYLTATDDLRDYNWTLSGKITGVSGTNPNERVRFEIKLLDATIVPEPSFYAALAIGLAGLAFVVRRRRMSAGA
jgi:hypothetical protein